MQAVGAIVDATVTSLSQHGNFETIEVGGALHIFGEVLRDISGSTVAKQTIGPNFVGQLTPQSMGVAKAYKDNMSRLMNGIAPKLTQIIVVAESLLKEGGPQALAIFRSSLQAMLAPQS